MNNQQLVLCLIVITLMVSFISTASVGTKGKYLLFNRSYGQFLIAYLSWISLSLSLSLSLFLNQTDLMDLMDHMGPMGLMDLTVLMDHPIKTKSLNLPHLVEQFNKILIESEI